MTVLAWSILAWQAFAVTVAFVNAAASDKIALALVQVLNLFAVMWAINYLMVFR